MAPPSEGRLPQRLLSIVIVGLAALGLLSQAGLWYALRMEIPGPSADASIMRSYFAGFALQLSLGLALLSAAITGVLFKKVGVLPRIVGLAPAILLAATFLWDRYEYLSDPRTGAEPHTLEVEIRNSGSPVDVVSVGIYGDGDRSSRGVPADLGPDQRVESSFLIFGALDRRCFLYLKGGPILEFAVPVEAAPQPMGWSAWAAPRSALKDSWNFSETTSVEPWLQIEARFRVLKE